MPRQFCSKWPWEKDLAGRPRRQTLPLRKLGIKEYFLYDPEALYLDPPLQGFRLVNGRSVPIKPNADGSLTSRELGLRLVVEKETFSVS